MSHKTTNILLFFEKENSCALIETKMNKIGQVKLYLFRFTNQQFLFSQSVYTTGTVGFDSPQTGFKLPYMEDFQERSAGLVHLYHKNIGTV